MRSVNTSMTKEYRVMSLPLEKEGCGMHKGGSSHW